MPQNKETRRMDTEGISYDWAVPQSWWDETHKCTGLNPAGHIVWRYAQNDGMWGRPYAIDMLGWIIIRLVTMKQRETERGCLL